MWTLRDLIDTANHTRKEIDGQWVPARPLPGPFWWTVKDAWAVLTGKADAVRWPMGQ